VVLHNNLLAEARLALRADGEPVRQRLDRAALLFWQAYVFQGAHWPEHLQERAAPLLARLVGGGRMKNSIAAMDDHTASQLAYDLLQFINEALGE